MRRRTAEVTLDREVLNRIRALSRPGEPNLLHKVLGLYSSSSAAVVEALKRPGSSKETFTVWRVICCVTVLFGLGTTSAHARHHHSRSDSDTQAGQFDYYVLSFSWAPSYCLTHSGDSAECGGRGYGLVVHGLWPQYDGGGYPENCATRFELTGEAAARGRTIYPSERLMEHEWREHGACSGLDALNYFQNVDRATSAVKTPAALDAPRAGQQASASQIIDLYRRANPQMPGNALIVACSRGELSEVRLCLTKDLLLRSCGRGVRTTCPADAVTIPASR